MDGGDKIKDEVMCIRSKIDKAVSLKDLLVSVRLTNGVNDEGVISEWWSIGERRNCHDSCCFAYSPAESKSSRQHSCILFLQ
ncbi:hypothetical protein RJT34_11537 [Clitoria ternatea]|uniref:Uncharacterized protein n=1 Tax=Clitoria ternatea TaxID=43366 RepID=A0AAN9JM41_CLITE